MSVIADERDDADQFNETISLDAKQMQLKSINQLAERIQKFTINIKKQI